MLQVKGFNLIYSGNFIFETELNSLGRLRINFGIHPMGMQWVLEERSLFHTPECVLVRSGDGLGGMSRVFHRLYMDKLIPKSLTSLHPLVVWNSWEAEYFDVSHDSIVQSAKKVCFQN